MKGLVGAAVALLALAGGEPAPRETVERFFKAIEKKDAAAAAALLHAEATLGKLGEEKPEAAGSGAVVEALLGRFPEFPNWSSKLGERIAAGPWVAARERAAMERGEKPRETLFLFQVREGKIRRLWSMPGDGEGGGEGAASLLVEKWNEKDLPRFVALFEGGASLWELPSGERLAAGEDDLRERYAAAFESESAGRFEVLERMSLSPWVVYLARGGIEATPPATSMTVFQIRDGLIRRAWFAR